MYCEGRGKISRLEMKALVLGFKNWHSFSLGLHTMLFEAEIYAIKACITKNIDKGYKGRHIYIMSNSQALIKVLNNLHINSKLVWDFHQSLVKQAEHNRGNW